MKAQDFLRDSSRWLLLAALILAPWNYGSTPDESISPLLSLLGLALGLWIAGHSLGTVRALSRPRKNEGADRGRRRCLAGLTLLTLVVGWWMAVNAKTIYDADFHTFVFVKCLAPTLPGSVDQALSVASMLRMTVLLGAMWMAMDLVRDRRWLLRLWNTIGLAGGSIALLGLLQKASGAPMIFWRSHEPPLTTFFATYFYHGNAGAFLNLTLPLTIGLAVRSFRRPGQPLVRALWCTLGMVSVVASFANTSRMSQFLAAAMLLVLAARVIPSALGAAQYLFRTTTLAGLLALVFAGYAIVQTSRLDESVKRWERLSETVPMDNRWVASQVAWRAMPDASWLGFGPGTFSVVFPYYSASAGKGFTGYWKFLHEDYLQTLLDWGWLGSSLLACLFFGAMTSAAYARWKGSRAEGWSPRQRLFIPLILLALASVALHALVDFPLQVVSIQLYVAVYIGVCWGSGGWGEVGRYYCACDSDYVFLRFPFSRGRLP